MAHAAQLAHAEQQLQTQQQQNAAAHMQNPQLAPRYAHIASFFRCALADAPGSNDVAVIGVPYDGGTTNRPGARHAPRAVRDASTLIRRAHPVSGLVPFDALPNGGHVLDAGDVALSSPFDLHAAHADITAFYAALPRGCVPLSVGGDHSVSLPILRALAAQHGALGLVHVDAHCDTGDDYLGSRFHHGAPFRRAVEERLIDPHRTIQIGIRGSLGAPDFWAFSRESGMTVVPMERLYDDGWAVVARRAVEVARGGPVYLTFDIDALDPAFAPGTGTPEAGGLNVHEAQRLLRALGELDIIGADLVEVSPPWDVGGLTSLNAANLLFEQLCLLVQAAQRRAAATAAGDTAGAPAAGAGEGGC